MAILEMKYYGSSVLKRVAKPVKQLNRENDKLFLVRKIKQ